MTTAQRRYQYHILLRHHSTGAVLLLQHEHGWMLPCWIDDEIHFWQSVEHINAALRTLLNVDAVTLRCVGTEYNTESDTVQRVYEAWVRGPEWTPPPSAQWV